MTLFADLKLQEIASAFNLFISVFLKNAECGTPNGKQVLRGAGYSHTLPIRVCAAQRGRDFEAPDLEPGIHFRGVF